jgi:hypothetical protein
VINQGSQMKVFPDRIKNDPGLVTRIDRSSDSGISVSIKRT